MDERESYQYQSTVGRTPEICFKNPKTAAAIPNLNQMLLMKYSSLNQFVSITDTLLNLKIKDISSPTQIISPHFFFSRTQQPFFFFFETLERKNFLHIKTLYFLLLEATHIALITSHKIKPLQLVRISLLLQVKPIYSKPPGFHSTRK